MATSATAGGAASDAAGATIGSAGGLGGDQDVHGSQTHLSYDRKHFDDNRGNF